MKRQRIVDTTVVAQANDTMGKPTRKEWPRVFGAVITVAWAGDDRVLRVETPPEGKQQHLSMVVGVSKELARRAAWVFANDRGGLCGVWKVTINDGTWPARAELVAETEVTFDWRKAP